ncbi:MAG: hypothetical protein ACU85V_12975, partial [Gammaproteobacteria bacterium]
AAMLAALAALAGGCASTPPGPAASAAETAAYARGSSRAERVFLYQSRMADALLNEYPLVEIFEEADPALIEAEATMTRSCSPLTQAVIARLEGDGPSLGLRLQVFTTIGECEKAARTIDNILHGGRQSSI